MRKLFSFFLACLAILTAVASADLKPDSTVDDALVALNASGKNIRSFAANLRWTEYSDTYDSTKTHLGKVWFQITPDGSPVIRVRLDQKQVDGKKPVPDKVEYLLDDGWLTTRTDITKTESQVQLAPKGKKVNLFQLGQGLFTLPIGEDPKDVHKQFDVSKIAPVNDDPPGTIHLLLKPKPDSVFATKFFSIDVWVDLKTHMPSRVKAVDPRQAVEKTVDFGDLQIDPKINAGDLILPPLPPDWRTSQTPMKS